MQTICIVLRIFVAHNGWLRCFWIFIWSTETYNWIYISYVHTIIFWVNLWKLFLLTAYNYTFNIFSLWLRSCLRYLIENRKLSNLFTSLSFSAELYVLDLSFCQLVWYISTEVVWCRQEIISVYICGIYIDNDLLILIAIGNNCMLHWSFL